MVSVTGIAGAARRAHQYPHELSGGMRQRVLIAMALMMRPALVIADEPTGNLDSSNAKEFMALLHDLQERFGVTIIIATHDEEVASHAQRRLRLRDGSIISDTKN